MRMLGSSKKHLLTYSLLAFFILGMGVTFGFDYQMGVARQIIGGTSYIENTGYVFTGKSYCTGYYYLNHKMVNAESNFDVSRASLVYDTATTNINGDYGNAYCDATNYWSTILTGNIFDFATDAGNSFLRFRVNKDNPSCTVAIPYTYTIGRFVISNKTNISANSLHFYFGNNSLEYDTYMNHTSQTTSNFFNNFETGYGVTFTYVAEPCIHDGPINVSLSNYVGYRSGGTANQYGLSNEFALFGSLADDVTSVNAGRPITKGSDFTVTTDYLPAQINNRRSIDHGVYLVVKEPDGGTNLKFSHYYSYTGSARGSGVSLVDASYISTGTNVGNQWGIDPSTLVVHIAFTGVDKTNYAHAGSYCRVTITGENNLSNDGNWITTTRSWNMNRLDYEIRISSGALRTLAKQQCSSAFASVDTGNIEYKRETNAYVDWAAYDLSHSMIITQTNGITFTGPNLICGAGNGTSCGTTGYVFNGQVTSPTIAIAIGTSLLGGSLVYNVPVSSQYLTFTGTDAWAGINSGTFLIIVSGYESSYQRSANWRTTGTPERTYAFSGTDLTLTPFNTHDERDDYSGIADFLANVGLETGTHYTIYYKVADFVGNITSQSYTFRTPTWPNAPHANLSSTNVYSSEPLPNDSSHYFVINRIIQDTAATDDPSNTYYDYLTYYPNSSLLVSGFTYQGASSAALVLTAYNGNTPGNDLITLTGLSFINGNIPVLAEITGMVYVSSGGQPVVGMLSTTFTFTLDIVNVYGSTGTVTYEFTVHPSCGEAAGCTNPIYIFWGTTLLDAQNMETAAWASGLSYVESNHWYPHWYAQIINTADTFYFEGAGGGGTGDYSKTTLYCAGTGSDLLIEATTPTGPSDDYNGNYNPSTSLTFSGTSLTITGDEVIYQFGVPCTGCLSVQYVSEMIGGYEQLTLHIIRPLTGKIQYSDCEFITGATVDFFGCPENTSHNRTGDINWTKLSTEPFVMTAWVEGGWLTGTWNGYFYSGADGNSYPGNNGAVTDFWTTGNTDIYYGGGKRTYMVTGFEYKDFATSGVVLFTLENITGYTTTMSSEVYWVDNTAPQLYSGIVAYSPNRYKTLQLSGINTGILANSLVSDLIGDDEWIITSFSGYLPVQLYLNNTYPGTIITGGDYIAGSSNYYTMSRDLMFASDWTGDICYIDRAGNTGCIYVDVTGIGSKKDVLLTVRPAFRPDPASNDTGYAIFSGDFWFWVYSGTYPAGEWIQNYNSAKISTDGKITTTKYGTGIVSLTTPLSGSLYLLAFKGSGLLSLGFTGIWNDDIAEFNLFSGDLLNDMSSDVTLLYHNGSYLENYLKAGDVVAYSSGTYDHVFGSDFTEINLNLSIGTNVIPYHRYDFDINDVLSSMEQAMTLQSYGDHGFIGYMDFYTIIPLTGFIDLP